jgi:HK97 family phage major capsid protein
MAKVDIHRGTTGIVLPPEVSSEIWSDMQSASAVQRLATRVNVPGQGMTIPIITNDPEPQWVPETEEKPVSRPGFASKSLTPYTLAVIVPFSKQFARDLAGLYSEVRARLPLVLARKFDRTVFGFDDGPGSNFDQLGDVPEISLSDPETVYDSTVAALASVVESADGADITGWALSAQAEILTLGSKDTTGRPLYIGNVSTEGSVGALLGRPAYKTPNVHDSETGTVGFGGDWSTARWGYVEAISVELSQEATLKDGSKTIYLWQQNMLALKAEMEIGFVVRDPDRFVRLTNGGGTSG